MKTLLIPYKMKKIGIILLLLSLLLLLAYAVFPDSFSFLNVSVFSIYHYGFNELIKDSPSNFFEIIQNNITDEIISIIGIIGLIFIGFSKEKKEDEFIHQIRLRSLLLSIYINYSILLLGILFIYGLGFFWVMIFNLLTPLIVFNIHYSWSKYKLKKEFL